MVKILIPILFLLSTSLTYSQIEVQGHRGARGLAPENTIPGFLKALELGVNTLELDIVISKDRKVVVSHEPWLNPEFCLDPEGNRIPRNSRSFNLYEMNYSEIKQCDCGSIGNDNYPEQEKIKAVKPLLSEVLKVALSKNPDIKFNIEIKSSEQGDGISHPSPEQYIVLVYEVIKDLRPDQYNIQSFDQRILRGWRNSYPDSELAYLVGNAKSWEKNIEELGFQTEIYSPHYRLISTEKVALLHKAGMKVIPWTVNNEDDMKKVIEMNVDGIITDYPDRLIGILKSK